MPGPIIIDVLEILGLLSLAVVAYFLGRLNARWPAAVQRVAILIALLLIAFVGCVYLGLLPLESRRILFYLRGPKVVLALVAVFFLGVAWHEPRRSFSPVFLLFLAVAAGSMLLIESTAPLYWRFLAADSWARTPDGQGCLKQSTIWSCGPAALAMLLQRHGIEASEGEMAYLSRTSFLGTDGFALARAVDDKIAGRGWSCVFEQTDLDHCLTRRQPFIATIRSAGMFAHAIVVDQIGTEGVTVVDPMDGVRKLVLRGEFAEKWNGEAMYIVFK